MLRTLVLIVYLFLTLDLIAQCCSGGVPMASNIGMGELEGRGFQLELSYDQNSLEKLKSGSTNLKEKSRSRITRTALLESGFSFGNGWSVDALMSVVAQERTILIPLERQTRTSGFGDMAMLVKYRVNPMLLVGYGLKLPTGKFDKNNELGLLLNADLQPGSGAWDQLAYMSLRHASSLRPSMTYSLSATARLTGKNRHYLNETAVYEFGNEFVIVMGVSDMVLIKGLIIRPAVNINTRYALRDKFDDIAFPSSGGIFLRVNPQVSVQASQNIQVIANTTIPVFQHVFDTQLAMTNRFNLGFHFTLSNNLLKL
ncbi:MAG: hypothetical protein JXQ90_16100 [Cyclobacteriaceae bacterium]